MNSLNDTKPIGSAGIIKRAFAAIILIFSINTAFAGKPIFKDKNDVLEVTLRPTINDKAQSNITVKLYKLNEVIQTIESTEKPKVFFTLEKNQMYTIEVSKPGYITRQISISTHIPDEVILRPIFRYDMKVELLKEVEGINKYYFEFPIAVISYRPLEDKFDYNKEYTANIKAAQRKELMRANVAVNNN